MSEELLRIVGLSKSFPGVKALDKVDFTLKRGSVHALMGENGAGKSTLMKCLFGVYSPDEGEIFLEGRSVRFQSSREALDGGVAMVHQELNQAGKLTIAENTWLGRFPTYSPLLPLIDKRKMIRRTEDIFAKLNISIDPRERTEELSVSKRQMAEIAKAVSYDAKIIVFDEPTSSLSEAESEKLFSIIDMLKRGGCGIIYISHKMNEILRICDTVTVMRDGRRVCTEAAADMDTEKIIRLMVGREMNARFPKRVKRIGEPLLEVSSLSAKNNHLREASFKLRSGEILGVSGLEGSGRTELLEAIFGLSDISSGELILDGIKVKNRTPKEAIKNGFALLTEERRSTGIFGILDIERNTTISSLKALAKLGIVSDKKAVAATKRYAGRMRVKTPSLKAKIQNLSGGNQQKVILARWLLTEPKVLLLDEPTRGIDVGAKYEIYALLGEIAESGCGIIVVSSEMEELFGITDRIIVMSGGRIAGEVVTEGATSEELMRLSASNIEAV